MRSMLTYWADPLLDAQITVHLRQLAEDQEAQMRRHLLWHADLLARCRKDGVADGFDGKLSEGELPQPPGDGDEEAEGQDQRALLSEVERLQGTEDRDSQRRLLRIVDFLLSEEVWTRIAEKRPDDEVLRPRFFLLAEGRSEHSQ